MLKCEDHNGEKFSHGPFKVDPKISVRDKEGGPWGFLECGYKPEYDEEKGGYPFTKTVDFEFPFQPTHNYDQCKDKCKKYNPYGSCENAPFDGKCRESCKKEQGQPYLSCHCGNPNLTYEDCPTGGKYCGAPKEKENDCTFPKV